MSTQTSSRPVGVDELKRAWHAVNAGEFRTGAGAGKGPRGRGTAAEDDWSPAAGEHTIAVIGCAGSVGASTVALAAGLAAAGPVRVDRVLLGHRLRSRRGQHRRARPAPDRLASGQARPRPARARQRGPRRRRRGPAADRRGERDPADHPRRRLGGRPAAGHRLLARRGRPHRGPGRPGHHRDRPRDASRSASPWTCWPATGSPSRSPSPCAGPAARSGRAASSTPAAPPYAAPWTRTGAWRSPRTASSRSTAWTPDPSRPP